LTVEADRPTPPGPKEVLDPPHTAKNPLLREGLRALVPSTKAFFAAVPEIKAIAFAYQSTHMLVDVARAGASWTHYLPFDPDAKAALESEYRFPAAAWRLEHTLWCRSIGAYAFLDIGGTFQTNASLVRTREAWFYVDDTTFLHGSRTGIERARAFPPVPVFAEPPTAHERMIATDSFLTTFPDLARALAAG
jgi:hypothetical protein